MEKNEYTAKYNEYNQLLDATYSQAVAYLLNKYGAVTDDYYKEKSYTRFKSKVLQKENTLELAKDYIVIT
ncbi:Uncharacterised protein [Staphylococcus aureus]|nr:Uncharacterised protein [Staphylococcus aureus]